MSEKKPSPLPLTRSIQFVAGAKQQSSIPPASYLGNAIQIAFAGRSNVGKSSLLNALLEKRISRVSEKPGQTQQILWFRVHLRHDHPTVHAALRARNFNTDNDPEMLLLDFPGYGFAYAKEQVQEKWKETMYTALANGMVKMLWLLIDARHGLKSSDREFVQLLVHTKTPFRVVLTKSDLVFPEELARRYQHTCEQLRECGAPGAVKRGVVMVSTRTGAGVRNLQRLLCETIGQKRARQKKQGDEWLAGRK